MYKNVHGSTMCITWKQFKCLSLVELLYIYNGILNSDENEQLQIDTAWTNLTKIITGKRREHAPKNDYDFLYL